MALTILPAALQGGVVLGTVTAPIYTAPTGKSATVKRAVFVNTGAAATLVTVTVTRGANPALTIIQGRSIGAGAADLAPELSALVLNPNDVLAAFASTGAVVNCFVSGLTVA